MMEDYTSKFRKETPKIQKEKNYLAKLYVSFVLLCVITKKKLPSIAQVFRLVRNRNLHQHE